MTSSRSDSADRDAGPLRVIEVADDVAGQALGRLLAALSHEVIKVEPPAGDPLRSRCPVDGAGLSYAFAALNADKRSVVIDLETEGGRERLDELLAGGDILVCDLAPRHACAAGLGTDRLCAAWPALIAVVITAFGIDDPRSDSDRDALLAESFGGLTNIIGEPHASPLSLGGEQLAYAGALTAYLGAMVALRGRLAGGGGDLVDVALCDVAAYVDWKSDVTHASSGVVPRRTGATAGRWRIVQAADGWVGVIYQPDQWAAMQRLIGDERLADPGLEDEPGRAARAEEWWPVVAEWAARRNKTEIYEQAQSLGLAFGYSADIADLCRSPQMVAREFIRPSAGPDGSVYIGPLARAEGLTWRCGLPPALGSDTIGELEAGHSLSPEPAELPSRPGDRAPLTGLVVLDLGTITAGAATSRLLADYGATVVKVESPAHPDPFRYWPVEGWVPESPRSVSPMFESNNAGKLSVALDLKSPEGQAAMMRLVETADVLVENYSVGVTGRLGVDAETLRRVNPDLIYLSLSSHGQFGPEAGNRSYGSTLDLLCGLASVTGYRSGSPTWSSAEVNYPDQLVSLFAAGVVLHCLSGGIRGVHLDVAQRELVTWTLSDRIAQYLDSGEIASPSGNRRPGRTPHDVYPCASEDQWVAIVCRSDADRSALAGVIGSPKWEQRPRADWLAGADELDALISAWTAARPRADVLAALAAAAVPCAPVLDSASRAGDPYFTRRRVFLDGPRRKGFPFQLSGYAPPDPEPTAPLGWHTDVALELARDARTAVVAATGPAQQAGTR